MTFINRVGGSVNKNLMPPKSCTNVKFIIGNENVTIFWRDPIDVIIKDVNLNEWSGTKLVMNTTHIPVNEKDGILIIDSKVRDQYEVNGYKIENLTNEQTYYFALFPYTANNMYNIDTTLQSGVFTPSNFLSNVKPLNECTPLEIKTVAEAGYASGNSWVVDFEGTTYNWFTKGDTVDITLTTGEVITVILADFNHDVLSDNPNNTAPFTFLMENCLNTKYRLHGFATNTMSWQGSEFRDILNSTIYETIPEDWRNVIVSITKKTLSSGTSVNIINTEDKLWLLSERELVGNSTNSGLGEGEYYNLYNTTNTDRIKTVNGLASTWYLRSPGRGNNTDFCIVNSLGNLSTMGSSNLNGISFGFCVA